MVSKAESRPVASQNSNAVEALRLLDKGKIKEAFKAAKIAYRQQATPEHRQLLERTYLLRIKELVQGGMSSAAAEVAQHLLELGVTDPALRAELATLLIEVGLANQAVALTGQLPPEQAPDGMTLKMADRAVTHPAEASRFSADLQQGAQRVRAALAALDADDEAAATTQLQDIPRSSPFADWRYFVRGWAAYRRGDREQARANWERLDPNRAASRIVATFRQSPKGKAGESGGGPDLTGLEIALFGEPVLRRLAMLKSYLDRSNDKPVDWAQVLQTLGPLRQSLKRIDPQLAEQLTAALMRPVVEYATSLDTREGQRVIQQFTQLAEPLAIDPHWNRFWALLYEQAIGGSPRTRLFWEKYASDVATIEAFPPPERRRVQAAVWRKIAQLASEHQRAESGFGPFLQGPEKESKQQLGANVSAALKRSLALDPQQRATYQLWIDLAEEAGDEPAQIEAAKALVAAFPDDAEAHRLLVELYRGQEQFDAALVHAEKVRELRPLDTSFATEVAYLHAGRARLLAGEGRYDEARAAFAAARALFPAGDSDVGFLARQAILEYKAGNEEAAAELVRRAQACLKEPAPVWLVLAIESARYHAPAALTRRFNEALHSALKKRTTGYTAAQLARLMIAYQNLDIDYPQANRHRDAVVAYIARTTRTRYEADELAFVCSFLVPQTKERKLCEKFALRGSKAFPDHPLFPYILGALELQRGPFGCDLNRAVKLFTKARTILDQTPNVDPELRAKIQEAELLAQDLRAAMPHRPFRGISLEDIMRIFESEAGDEDDEGDEDDQDESGSGFFERAFGRRRKRK